MFFFRNTVCHLLDILIVTRERPQLFTAEIYMTMVHGLAASIRGSKENETFDLGGQNVATITSAIQSAFEEPFQDLIRITFVTGAGKAGRQKYDDGAAQAITSTLKNLGYREDRGASCILECAGSYKLQHDTGKNLKTVVVFPKVVETENGLDSSFVPPIISEDSPEYKIMVSSMNVFKNIVTNKCPSWSQKKGLLGAIEGIKEILGELDEKLIRGVPLGDSEEAFYHDVSELHEKEAMARHELLHQVEVGNVTKFEKDLLLLHNSERIASLEKDGGPTDKALQRRELLESIDPVPPHKLKYEAEIRKLQKELVPLLNLEANAKGRLLSVKETQTLARKDEILEEIASLEEASRGWFEDDDAFESRVQACRNAITATSRKKAAGKVATIGSDTKVKVSANKWVTPGEGKVWSKSGAKKKGKVRGEGVFSAMVMDSDDDDDFDEDDNVDSADNGDEGEADGAAPAETTASSTKKKSKKKKKKQQFMQGTEEVTANQEETRADTALAQANAVLQAYILPIVLAFVGWFAALLFGKPKKRGDQQS
jgi:hypothetical protein